MLLEQIPKREPVLLQAQTQLPTLLQPTRTSVAKVKVGRAQEMLLKQIQRLILLPPTQMSVVRVRVVRAQEMQILQTQPSLRVQTSKAKVQMLEMMSRRMTAPDNSSVI